MNNLEEQATTAQADVVKTTSKEVKPKATLVGNISPNVVVLPDLKNDIDESGFSINPGDKVDLTLYYSAREINRSRSLDNALNGVIDSKTGKEIKPAELIHLQSLDDIIPEIPKHLTETATPGASFEAAPNYADENLEALDRQEQKELEKMKTRNRHMNLNK